MIDEKIKLDLHHRECLKPLLQNLGDGLSEYCFSNLFLFRNVHQYEIIKNKWVFIAGKTYDDGSFLMPLFDLSGVSTEFLVKSIQPYDFYFPISKRMLSFFNGNVFSHTFNPDDSDYVYSMEKLKTYKGRKLSRKKNLMRQFTKNHSLECRTIKPNLIKDAEDILFEWLAYSGKSIEETDTAPCLEALSNLRYLDFSGYIFYADGEPAGFVLAKEAAPGICVFHFAKGSQKYKGVYQYMFNYFARKHATDFRFCNFEQDLGKPNFRATKASYSPDLLLEKYRVRLSDN